MGKQKHKISIGTDQDGRVSIRYLLDGIPIPRADFKELCSSTDAGTPDISWGERLA